ncbi:MAG TPA: GspH/FimT family pseudopilin [Casimicrobiaceae bacterium]|nr:GspH/FimT family pseudopilin [Casimicrobiaceae bacterium]
MTAVQGFAYRFADTPSAGVDAMRTASGFTLIEMLVVLTLIGLLVAVVIPMFGPGVSTTELKSDARAVAAGLRQARGQAIAQRGEAVLMLDLGAHSFSVPPDPRVHKLAQELELKLFTAQSDLINDNVGAIRFFPDGGSNGGRITLASGERKFNVDVDWLTGRVAILE